MSTGLPTRRRLGRNGPQVGAVGFGCMSMAGFYGPVDPHQSQVLMRRALDLGVDFWDTADVYGMGGNEELVGAFLKGRSEQVVLASKGGIVRKPGATTRTFDNSPAYLASAIDASLRRLQRDHIDLYYIHRREPTRPVEEAIEGLALQVKAGKIGAIGLSEVSPDTLRRAHAVHPIAAVQSEYSLWTRTPELGLIQACAELGVAFVPFGVLGRKFLTGRLKRADEIAQSEFLKVNPRFQEPNWSRNLDYLTRFEALSRTLGRLPGQLAIAWALAQGQHVIPIPGTRQPEHLAENVMAGTIVLSEADVAAIEATLPQGFAAGERYTTEQWPGIERYG
jgi:aryl-alcohol dehydrogenase-like predicted oxidoreductase